MNKYKPTLSEVAVKSGLAGKDTAEKEARLDVYKIAHGQDQGHAGCGVLVYDQKVDDHELSKHCIITITEVVNSIENKIFEKGEYKVTFRHKNKQFDLRNVTKVVRSASGLVLIFINSSCKELKKCSILSESRLSIAAPDHSSKSSLFCFIENQRYNVVESTGENGEKGVYDLEPDSKTATSASDSPKEIPHGTVILQYDAHHNSLMAVGIFKVVDKKHMKISPIWFKSSLNNVLASSTVQTDGKPQTQTTSESGSSGDTPGNTTDNQELSTAVTDQTTEGDPCVLELTGVWRRSLGGTGASSTVQTDGKPQTQTTSESGSSGDTPDKLGLQMNIENVPNSQEVLNAIASRYLQSVRPSNTEEFNAFKQYLTDERKLLTVDTQPGSLIVTVRCSSLQILEELWQDYRSGHLNEMAQECLVTNEILTKFGLKEAKLTTTILEKEYRTCREYFLELLVADQSVSKEVTNNDLLLEKLSKTLDRERRHIQCWKHLAFVLDVPPEERRKFDRYTEHSPTEDMFNYVDNTEKADLKVKDLKTKLKAIYRNDVIIRLNEEKYDDEKEVSQLTSRDGKFIGILSSMLDTEMNGWKSLAPHFNITKETIDQFGLPGPGPTAELFFYMSTTDDLKDLTVGELRKHFEAMMPQSKLVEILPKDKDSSLVTKEVAPDSKLLEDIGKRLNKNTPGVENWRNLAVRLEIPFAVYDAFDTSKGVKQGPSPTKMLFQWLEKAQLKLTVKDLLNGLRKINRYDVVQLVIEEVARVH